ncbi:MAG: HAMP domain-containing protein [Deltaproteobacteria bacterium]|nr:HAMP domain-containing protein [Deltaproteobacteria bacterium]
MKLYQQLILFVLTATAIPLVVGLVVLSRNESQLLDGLMESRRESAARLAELVDRDLGEVLERIQAALGYVKIEGMSADEMEGLLGIVYKQSEDIIQVALVDDRGKEVTRGVYLERPEDYPEYQGRLDVSVQRHQVFVGSLPLDKALSAPPGSAYISRPQALKGSAFPCITILFPLLHVEERATRICAVEFSLAHVVARVLESGYARGWQATILDPTGGEMMESSLDESGRLTKKETAIGATHAKIRAGKKRGAFLVGEAILAFAQVGLTDWSVVLWQEKEAVWSEVRQARYMTLAWTGASIFALLVLGSLFTGRITRNLRRIAAGAESFSKGALDTRITLESRDELGLLARTFNQMGEDLEKSRQEIEAWNRELAQRVEERTRELEIAHRRLLETSKLAAIGQLGAGVAHEVNNPLVGILGNVQLLLLKQEDGKTREVLSEIEGSAKRCRDVIQKLLHFSEQEEEHDHLPVDLNKVVEDAFSLTRQRFESQQIEVRWNLDADLPELLGDQRQLMQVFLNLLSNARTAMPDGGVLEIETSRRESEIVAQVRDTGRGIPPEQIDRIFEPFFTTKDVWTNTGLGLSESYRIITDHGGRIVVESTLGSGSSFKVVLPVGRGVGE